MPLPIELTEEWVPPELLVRDKQLKELEQQIKKENSIYISGGTGIGKTLTTRALLGKLGKEYYTIYAPPRTGIIDTIRNGLYTKGESPRWTAPDLQDQIAELGEHVVIALDDFHVIMEPKVRGAAMYFLKGLYDLMKSKLQVIIISKSGLIRFQKDCPKEVFNRFWFKGVPFPQYTPKELTVLLEQRVKPVWGTRYDAGALNLISGKMARYGEMRMGIRILAECYAMNPNELNGQLITDGWHSERTRYWQEELTSKEGHSGLFLYLISKLVNAQIQNGSKSNLTKIPFIINSNTLYPLYESTLKGIGIEPLYLTARKRELDRLREADYVALETHGRGRGKGVGSIITLTFDDPQAIEEAGKSLKWEEILA